MVMRQADDSVLERVFLLGFLVARGRLLVPCGYQGLLYERDPESRFIRYGLPRRFLVDFYIS